MTAPQFDWVCQWEWSDSVCLTYVGFSKAYSPIGEYSDKFMANQQVLGGAYDVTSPPPQPHYISQFFFSQIFVGNILESD